MNTKRMTVRTAFLAAVLAPLSPLLWSATAPSSDFIVDKSTMAPGVVLQPGTYSIRVVDHLEDRFLVTVEGNGGVSKATFIAVPTKSFIKQSGPVNWGTSPNAKAAMRGFVFSDNNSALEFVYPKDEAVSLAKANGIPVLAVDPASEGRPPELAQLSASDMQTVTLWMLTPERVSGQASNVAISAAKYQSKTGGSPNPQVASLGKVPTGLKQLPHTASMLPLTLLCGILATLAAGFLRIGRSGRVTE